VRARSLSLLLWPLSVALLGGCPSDAPAGADAAAASDAVRSDSADAARSDSGGSGGFTPSGPNGPGQLVPADSGPNPFGSAAVDLGTAPPPCDEKAGDFGSCKAPGPTSCLTSALCTALPKYLSPRTAGRAMDCIAALAYCAQDLIGDCFAAAGELACKPAAAGTQPCDALATPCAAGDPLGAVSQCLAMASVLTPAAATSIRSCLLARGECDPGALGECAASLLE